MFLLDYFLLVALRISKEKIKTKEVFSGKAKRQSAPPFQSFSQRNIYTPVPMSSYPNRTPEPCN